MVFIIILAMSVLKFPSTLCEDLQSLIARFWWEGGDKEKKIHWFKWDSLVKCKDEGGMGIRDFIAFNQALLAKLNWQIINNPNTLMAHVSKGKYFPNSDLFSASMGHNPSYLRRSLLLGRDLLQAAVRWIMGDGCSVWVFRDPWIPRPHLFKPITRPRPDEEEMRVADLMDAASWRLDRVERVFWNVDRLDVCSIPLGCRSRPDSLVWHYDSKGSYTVKTGYRLAMKLRFVPGGSDGNARCLWWRKLWKAHVPKKAKIHACFSKHINKINKSGSIRH